VQFPFKAHLSVPLETAELSSTNSDLGFLMAYWFMRRGSLKVQDYWFFKFPFLDLLGQLAFVFQQ